MLVPPKLANLQRDGVTGKEKRVVPHQAIPDSQRPVGNGPLLLGNDSAVIVHQFVDASQSLQAVRPVWAALSSWPGDL